MTPPTGRELTVGRGHFSVWWLVSWPGAGERGQQLGWFPTELKLKASSGFGRTVRPGTFYVNFQVLLNTLLLLILKFPIRLFYFFKDNQNPFPLTCSYIYIYIYIHAPLLNPDKVPLH